MRLAVLVRALIAVGVAGGSLAVASPAFGRQLGLHIPGYNHHVGFSLGRFGVESTNWSGYAVSGDRPYTRVTSSWEQPSVNCSVTPNSYAAFWDGLDGYSDSTVEQTGTLAECDGTTAEYYGWYEMYPGPMYTFGGTVSPGDVLAATVVSDGNDTFTLTLSDGSKWSDTTTQTLAGADLGSAEVITEAPSSDFGVLPLADFGVANFTDATLNGDLLTSSTPGIESITMVNSRGQAEATPSAISDGAFSDTWSATSRHGRRGPSL
jgi:Peptidase A4 family